MFQNALICLIVGVHKVSVVQMVGSSMYIICVCVVILVIKLTFDLSIYVFVAVAIVYEELFHSQKLVMHSLVRGASANGSLDERTNNARLIPGRAFTMCVQSLSHIGWFPVHTCAKLIVISPYKHIKER